MPLLQGLIGILPHISKQNMAVIIAFIMENQSFSVNNYYREGYSYSALRMWRALPSLSKYEQTDPNSKQTLLLRLGERHRGSLSSGQLLCRFDGDCLFDIILLQVIYNYYSPSISRRMAAIIDQKLFLLNPAHQPATDSPTAMAFHQKIRKITKITEESITLSQSADFVETTTHLKLTYCDFMVRVQLRKDGIVKAKAYLLLGRKYWRTASKHTEIMLMKKMADCRREGYLDGNIYIHSRRAVMAKTGFLIPVEGMTHNITQLYHRMLAQDLLAFEGILMGARVTGRGRVLGDLWPEHQQGLQLADILRTTQTNLGISEATSQFMFANRSFAEQTEQLAVIQKNILEGAAIEKPTGQLFSTFPREVSAWQLRNQLVPVFQMHIKKLKGLLLLKELEEKSTEDYNYNVVKVVEVFKDEESTRPIGQGASSIIYGYRIKLVFINSYNEGFEVSREEVQRVVAVKRLRQGYKSKRDKMAHEQQIVAKLKNSTSPFLPKYFAAPTTPDLANCLLMEVLHAQELDTYVAAREESMSLASKLQLLLNVVQGLRHLHGCGVVHLDLKPINIMVAHSLLPKLIDLGEAYHRDVCSKAFLPGFSFPWVAPEVYLRCLRLSLRREDSLQFSEKQDVFALGFILSELFFGTRMFNLPLSTFQQVWMKREVLQRVFYAAERGTAFGEELVVSTLGQLMVRCMDPDPEARPRVEWIGIALRLMLNSLTSLH